MKIKLMLILVLGMVTIGSAQLTELGFFDHTTLDNYSIYVGNLPKSWTTLGPRDVFSNDKKNVFVLGSKNKSKLEIKMRPNVKLMLEQNVDAKAFLVKKKWHIVNKQGEVIAKIDK